MVVISGKASRDVTPGPMHLGSVILVTVTIQTGHAVSGSKLPHSVQGILHITQRERPELQARLIFSVAHAYLDAHPVL
jgi:hypothetical protein